MATHFVQSGGSDANDGLDNTGVGLATADWTEATFTLTQAGHGYTFAAGDVIFLSAGTGVTTGLYEVASSTANDVVLVETSTLPTVGNASDVAAGDRSSSDITSSDGPLLTINETITTGGVPLIAAGDHIWIRGGTDYNETATIDITGTASAPIVLEGYTTNLGDNGKATINGQSTRGQGFSSTVSDTQYVFKNFLVKNCTDNGFENGTADNVTYKNCEADNNSNHGFNGDNGLSYEECSSHNNGANGYQGDNQGGFFGCQAYDNTSSGFVFATGTCVHCVAYGNGASQFLHDGSDEARFVNCTADSENAASTFGFRFSNGASNLQTVINCIAYDGATGFGSVTDRGEMVIARNNLVSSNTADYSSFLQGDGEVAAAPGFTDEATHDYTLTSGSAAKAAGADGGELQA